MLDEKIAGEGQRKSGRGGEDVEGVMGDNGMHRQVLDDAGEDRGGLDLSDRRGGGRERERARIRQKKMNVQKCEWLLRNKRRRT